MISYRIVSRLSPEPIKEFNRKGAPIHPKDPDFKFKLFQRVFSTTHWRKGQLVKTRRGNRSGIITKMYMRFEDIPLWKEKQPYFIEVLFDDGQTVLCARNQLVGINPK
jgi:hypothetical protein